MAFSEGGRFIIFGVFCRFQRAADLLFSAFCRFWAMRGLCCLAALGLCPKGHGARFRRCGPLAPGQGQGRRAGGLKARGGGGHRGRAAAACNVRLATVWESGWGGGYETVAAAGESGGMRANLELECIPKLVIMVSDCIPGFRSVCPMCIPTFKCVYHMCIPTFSSFIVLRAQFPSPSFPCGSSPDTMKQLSLKPHLTAPSAKDDDSSSSSGSPAPAAKKRRISKGQPACYHSMYPVGDGQDFSLFFHGLHVSHVYPRVVECVSCVYPKNEKCVSRANADTL